MAGTPTSEELEARLRLLDEHVQAEVDHDIEAIMRTWGRDPWFDDVAWDEQNYGREEIRAHYLELLQAFPDLHIEVHDRHVDGNTVILEVTVTGTHTGRWRDLPPLNRRMRSRVCALYTFDDEGMLNLERAYYDKAAILEQLGLFHDPRKPLGKVMVAITPPYRVVAALKRELLRRRRR